MSNRKRTVCKRTLNRRWTVTSDFTPFEALESMGKNGNGSIMFNWATRYTFRSPNESRDYVKVMKYLIEHGTSTKVDILEKCLHLRAFYYDNTRAYGEMSGLFSAMRNAYFIEYTKDHKVRLDVNAIPFLTKEGLI